MSDSRPPEPAYSELLVACGGSHRTAAYVSRALQEREGVEPKVDRAPRLDLLNDEERALCSQGIIPDTLPTTPPVTRNQA